MVYEDLVAFIGTEFQIPYSGSAFSDGDSNAIMARVIDFAEQRIYSKMNFLATRQTKSGVGYALTSSSRDFALPTTCLIIEGISVITPSTATPVTGKRSFVERTSLDFIDALYPSESFTGTPLYWAAKTDDDIVFGPTPSAAFPVELTGMFRPEPISEENPSTYLSLHHPQLLMAACAISWAGHQRDYGAQSDDPKLALSWKSEYAELMASAISEEKRRRGLTEMAADTAPQEA